MLKFTAASIASSLTELYNLSVTSGVFPVERKIGRIAPVPKGNDQTVPSGFRPISILPSFSKVMERHIKTIIESHLQEHAPISPRQWGFMSSRSSISALLKLIDDCLQALDEGHEEGLAIFDICKAFDTVPHITLLENLGIKTY